MRWCERSAGRLAMTFAQVIPSHLVEKVGSFCSRFSMWSTGVETRDQSGPVSVPGRSPPPPIPATVSILDSRPAVDSRRVTAKHRPWIFFPLPQFRGLIEKRLANTNCSIFRSVTPLVTYFK